MGFSLNFILLHQDMLLECILSYFLFGFVVKSGYGQFTGVQINQQQQSSSPLPFPPCLATDIECQRRGLRTFFFLMDSGYFGMTPVDPGQLNSMAVSFPDQQMSFYVRKLNVTGMRWTRLVDRSFNLPGGRSGVKFKSDLHVTGEITMQLAEQYEPIVASITMDIQDVESDIVYNLETGSGDDQEDYIIIGRERIAVRNSRTPTYFLQSDTEDVYTLEQILQDRTVVLDYISNEITTSLMYDVVSNFRRFAQQVPVKYYYKYY